MQDGSNDLNVEWGDWWLGNLHIESAFKFKSSACKIIDSKSLSIFFFVSLIINTSNAEIYKIGKLNIELFEPNKLIKTSGSINEGFGVAKIRIFAEKSDP